MTRIGKEPHIRRQEIVDAAIRLFASKGYAATTINDLLDAVGIAKGTLYHHFDSKEAVMRAVVVEVVDAGIAEAERVAADASLPAPDRVLAILASQGRSQSETRSGLVHSLHEAGNAEFHLLSHVATVDRLTPIVAGVVREGIAEGVFDTPYPEESVAVLLTAASFLTDEGFEGRTPDMERMVPALLMAADRLFGAAEGTFAARASVLQGGSDEPDADR